MIVTCCDCGHILNQVGGNPDAICDFCNQIKQIRKLSSENFTLTEKNKRLEESIERANTLIRKTAKILDEL